MVTDARRGNDLGYYIRYFTRMHVKWEIYRRGFKNFAFKGNVIDMAVGGIIVVGGAFSAIVNALVTYIIMPAISYGTAGLDFTDMKIVLRPAACSSRRR